MQLLLAGFALSLFGSLPPGLISLTVSQTSISRGLGAAMSLAAGAAVAEFFQAWSAVLLTDWFLSHPAIEQGFNWAMVPVFFGLGVHLLFFAKPAHISQNSDPGTLQKYFAKGLIISAFNLLAVPYWFVYCGWMRVEGIWKEGLWFTLVFALGVSIGTVFALSIYAWLGQLILRRSAEVARYANGVIGVIFLALGLKILWGLI